MSAIQDFVNEKAQDSNTHFGREELKLVSCRLPVTLVDKMDEVASKLGMVRSGLAAELLEIAIDEAATAVENNKNLTGGLDLATVKKVSDWQDSPNPVWEELFKEVRE